MIKNNNRTSLDDNSFSSREIHFLKTNSKNCQATKVAPNKYLSDMIFSDNHFINSFIKQVEQNIGNKFLCAVFKKPFDTDKKKTKIFLNNIFNSIIEKNHSIWEKIDKKTFILAIKNSNKKNTLKILKEIKKKISSNTETNIQMGAAWFPYMKFSKKDTFYNVLKAFDHACFLENGSLTFFDAVSLNISGDRLYHLGKIKDASLEYKKGLEIEKNNINLINSLGVCFGIMNKLEMAKKEFKKGIKIDPKEVMTLYNAGLIYTILNDHKKGIKYIQKASNINNNIFEIEITAGKLLYEKKKIDQALIHLKRAEKLNPQISTSFKIMGDLFFEKNNHEKAILQYKKAVKLNPFDAGSMSGLAR
ncbi:MAG: hypothetical protein B6I26_08630 [Desulfobacteraceae bacterium 4572_130]|nr:MAG: hypothetical protein B6I26_08630 [Desulfobacteraceae bacterium 4572_130]